MAQKIIPYVYIGSIYVFLFFNCVYKAFDLDIFGKKEILIANHIPPLLTTLATNPFFNELKLKKFKFHHEGYNIPSLRILILTLIVFRISSLSNLVAQNVNLTKLVLRKMNLGPEDNEKIVTALLSNTSVQLSYLDLSDNPIGVALFSSPLSSLIFLVRIKDCRD